MNSVSYISLIASVLCLGCKTLGAVSIADGTNTITLSSGFFSALLTEARTNNSGLQVAEKRVTASHLGIATVRQWEDPKFSFSGVVAGPRRGGLEAEGDLIYGIEQKLPLWNRPRLNRDILVTETQTRVAEMTFREGQLRRDLSKALLRMALVHRTISFVTNDLVWLDTLIALGEEKFRVGTGSHTDLLLIQNEKSKRADGLRTEQNRLLSEQAALNRLLGRDLQAPWPLVELPQLGSPVVYSPALAAYAATNEPRVKVLRQEKAQAQAVTRLTETMRRPDISVGLQARQFSGDAGLREGVVTVSLNLPWWNAPKYQADLRRDEAKVRAADAEITDYELAVREEILRLTLMTDAAYREAVLYRDEIMQRTQQGMASYLAMWQGNRGMLRDILDARRNYLDAQLMQDRAIVEQHQAMAELAALCDLPDYFQLPRLLQQLRNGAPHHPEPSPGQPK